MLDLFDVQWLKSLWCGDPGGEGSGIQHPLNNISRQVGSGMRHTAPLGDVLKLLGAAVLPQDDSVPEIWLFGVVLWLEAHEDGPRTLE